MGVSPLIRVMDVVVVPVDLKAAGDSAQLLLVQNMGHMFTEAGSKPIDPSLSQIAQAVVSFFNRERNS